MATYLFVGGYWISVMPFSFFFLFFFFFWWGEKGLIFLVATLRLSRELLLISNRNKLAKLVIYILANNIV
jgi:hypothetical protein